MDDTTVLKFPAAPLDVDDVYPPDVKRVRRSIREIAVRGLQVEEEILRRLGEHPRIVQLKGKHEDGLLLEYLPNGSVEDYLRANPYTSIEQRLVWAQQAAEGLDYIHTKDVVQSDVSVGNLLLDAQLSLKLCDFQGKILHPDGSVALDGGSSERNMSSMPRLDRSYHDRGTDIFAFGTVLYFIMTVELPFPDVHTLDEDEIDRRFKECEFPVLAALPGGDIIRKCWTGNYNTAGEILADLRNLQEAVG